ncbi:GCN5-related N-acetyltransferase, partial [mine drainage metagenome]
RALVDELLDEGARGEVLPFTVRVGAPARAVGTIRYLDIRRADRGVEIGTWLSPAVWRTPVNTEAKYLLLRHAFETERVHRVQLKADRRNERSQRAIRRLGAVPEGPMREHYRFDWGGYRTSEYFSILDAEWPAVRDRLERLMARPFDGSLAPRNPAPVPPER